MATAASESNGGASLTNVFKGTEVSPREQEHGAIHRRIFIGPMPERVISTKEERVNLKKSKNTLGSVFSLTLEPDRPHNGDKVEDVARMIKAHAFRFFLHEGGNPENWDDQQEDIIADELTIRWKDSDWGKLWSHRHHRRKNFIGGLANNQWFGTSFEVGNLLGVNLLQGGAHLYDINPQLASSKACTVISFQEGRSDIQAESVPLQSNASAKVPPSMSHTDMTSSKASRYESVLESPMVNEPETRNDSGPDEPTPASSITAQTEMLPSTANAKGKAKVVHYEDFDNVDSSSPFELPAPPEVVLSRADTTIEPVSNSSASALALDSAEPSPDDMKWGDIILRDRMLVRVSYTKDEGIAHFDEEINRTTRNLSYEDWGEFLVAWRRDSLEIYRDYNTPGREWITGHKHLSYVIPLKSSRTKLSLFSFVDLTFCITCAPTTSKLNTATSRWVFNREKEGTNIFIFKIKSRSRAYDWIWQLWHVHYTVLLLTTRITSYMCRRSMGGQIPPSIDIYIPRLSTKVTVDISNDTDNRDTSKHVFSRENVVQLCMNALHNIPDWQFVMDEQIKKGCSLALAWRSKANLDWIWLDDDVTGNLREWAVLCGLPMKQLVIPAYLEIRLAFHAANHVLKGGNLSEEPPSIEGYLDRIRPNTQTKRATYLSVHQGNIFILNPLTASPPMPPGLLNLLPENLDAQIQNLRHVETRRGMNQVMAAIAVMDLRTIIAVRRSFQAVPSHMHTTTVDGQDEENQARTSATGQSTAEDEEDEGGEAGLVKANNRVHARMRRSFELLLKSGHVIRFEAYSSKVAIEWIDRLRALIFYWRLRHRADAKQEIELAQAQRPRLTPQTRVRDDGGEIPPEPPVDLSAPFAAMDYLYNWCILEGCKAMTKTGRLYMRKGLRGQYKLVQLYLVAGHLVNFRITGHSSMYPVMRKKINLLDAYVCSGHLAAQCLPQGQYRPDAEPAPRRYQDGLETNDREEDMLFMVWYRPQPLMFDADQDPTVIPVTSRSVPSISAKHKMLVFKTRSILERDAWCWAINSEIEKIVRAQKPREEMLRETGGLIKLAN
ncbi:hypothetical protein BDN70DRAFT_855567 [Pholiota conissans]|uniref:PH domain-containing protein n=1 Tax=Pholiota conissans TaxID=109636 RepID=A0A9P5Z467_9AGAR|nr:hypothetical protein BDN70DRAFT_855567 [Pholiota conissans]